ncbi:hypothetical protein Halru_2785 [Halovivax ruber XH-70]|uniref:Uncharacterized protein n=1 Tax=Halovivax ruber (strain DSM 18193 / JCM 13892 / XH-70) TaxID=797302 RepID=L0IEV5_HALRX|nr:hypothetical protein [Halovivax ruber]AGB17358.1 hypothetical protein Halru_2785 [Halovivax ruber XH-70]
MRRRKLLAGLGSTATIPLVAGCLTDDDEDDDENEEEEENSSDDGNESIDDGENGSEDGNESDDGNESEDGNDNESTTNSIETLSQTELDDAAEDDRNVEATATVTADGESVVIEGQLEAATPCHEAVVTGTTLEDGTLTVRVGLEKTDADTCTQMISQIDYKATVDITDGEATSVVVVHTDRVDETTAADTEL